MRVYPTGATGFVGSNVAQVFAERHDAELFCPVRATPPPADAPYDWATVDLTDAEAVRRSVAGARPDAIVHAAILNDGDAMAADHRAAAAELLWRALERELTGVLHCVGGEHADRVTLARRAATAFGLDPALVRPGPPPALPPWRVPRDTRLDATATAAALGVELPDLDTQLAQLRHEMEGLTCRTT